MSIINIVYDIYILAYFLSVIYCCIGVNSLALVIPAGIAFVMTKTGGEETVKE